MKSTFILFIVFESVVILYAQTNLPPSIEQWSKPRKIVYGINPSVTWDGNKIYFISVYGIAYIEKIDTVWSEIHPLGPQVNNQMNVRKPVVSPDGKTLIFSGHQTDRLFRSRWNEQTNDWDTARIFNDNGISSGNGWWEVGSFLSDTSLFLEYLSEGRITYYDSVTGLWSTPQYFPQFPIYTRSDWGSWVSPDWKNHYYVYGTSNLNLVVQYFDSTTGIYRSPYLLNLSIMSDSLYNIGEYLSRSEHHPFLTPDGRTMYFQANYDTLGAYHSVWESKMIVDENGDTVLTSINDTENEQTDIGYYLGEAFPNPFNSNTKINYKIPETTHVTFQVFDILGNQVRNLLNREISAGDHQIEINSNDNNLSSGIYFYQLKAGRFSQTKKLILIK